MSAQSHSIKKVDLEDPRYYLVDANLLIDFCKGEYLDWLDTLPEKPIFLITDKILAETLLPARKIIKKLTPLGVQIQIVSLLDSEEINAQHAFLVESHAYQRPNDALSPVDSSLLAISLVHPNLKVVTNDGLLQYAFMDRHTRDIHQDDPVAKKECPKGLIFDHRAKDFCVAHIHLKYASAVFGLEWFGDVITHCKRGLDYLDTIPKGNSYENDQQEHSSTFGSDNGDKDDDNSLFRIKERLLEQLGWAYVSKGLVDNVRNVAQSMVRHNMHNTTTADKFFNIANNMNRHQQSHVHTSLAAVQQTPPTLPSSNNSTSIRRPYDENYQEVRSTLPSSNNSTSIRRPYDENYQEVRSTLPSSNNSTSIRRPYDENYQEVRSTIPSSPPAAVPQTQPTMKRSTTSSFANWMVRTCTRIAANEAIAASSNVQSNGISNWKVISNSLHTPETIGLDGNPVDPMFAPFLNITSYGLTNDGDGVSEAVDAGIDF